MGYSIYLGSDDHNVTYNVSKLLSEAFSVEHWKTFINGQNGLIIKPYFERALHRLENNPEYYKQFEASNGWGTVEQMIPYLRKWVESCERWPEENIEII